MLRNKYYISQDTECPEANIWVQMKGTRCGNPLLEIYGNGENGPEMLVSFSFAEASRLQSVLGRFIQYSSDYWQKTEEG